MLNTTEEPQWDKLREETSELAIEGLSVFTSLRDKAKSRRCCLHYSNANNREETRSYICFYFSHIYLHLISTYRPQGSGFDVEDGIVVPSFFHSGSKF